MKRIASVHSSHQNKGKKTHKETYLRVTVIKQRQKTHKETYLRDTVVELQLSNKGKKKNAQRNVHS